MIIFYLFLMALILMTVIMVSEKIYELMDGSYFAMFIIFCLGAYTALIIIALFGAIVGVELL